MKEKRIGYPDGEPRLAQERREIASGKMHDSNLFDENEDHAGEKTDLATGKPIDNSTARSEQLDRLSIRTGAQLEKDEDEPLDEAEHWLRENDRTHPKYTGKKKAG